MLNQDELKKLIHENKEAALDDSQKNIIYQTLQKCLSNCNDAVGFFSMFSLLIKEYFSSTYQSKGHGLDNLLARMIIAGAHIQTFEVIMQLYIEKGYILKLSLNHLLELRKSIPNQEILTESFKAENSFYDSFFAILAYKRQCEQQSAILFAERAENLVSNKNHPLSYFFKHPLYDANLLKCIIYPLIGNLDSVTEQHAKYAKEYLIANHYFDPKFSNHANQNTTKKRTSDSINDDEPTFINPKKSKLLNS